MLLVQLSSAGVIIQHDIAIPTLSPLLLLEQGLSSAPGPGEENLQLWFRIFAGVTQPKVLHLSSCVEGFEANE